MLLMLIYNSLISSKLCTCLYLRLTPREKSGCALQLLAKKSLKAVLLRIKPVENTQRVSVFSYIHFSLHLRVSAADILSSDIKCAHLEEKAQIVKSRKAKVWDNIALEISQSEEKADL